MISDTSASEFKETLKTGEPVIARKLLDIVSP